MLLVVGGDDRLINRPYTSRGRSFISESGRDTPSSRPESRFSKKKEVGIHSVIRD